MSIAYCECVCRYTPHSAHSPYCRLWPAQLYNIFPTLSHKGHDFRKKKIIEHTFLCFDFLFNLCLEHFSFYDDLKETDYDKNRPAVFMYSISYSCSILMDLEFSLLLFWGGEILKHKLSRKSVHWEPSCSMRTGRQTEGWTHMMKLRVSQFSERA